MKKLSQLLFGLLLLSLSLLSQGALAGVTIKGVRSWTAPERTRLVFDLSEPVKYHISSSGKSSLTLLMKQSRLKSKIPAFNKHRVIASVAARRVDKNNIRVTFKLRRAVKVKSFQLDPGGHYGYRLVLDFYTRNSRPVAKVAKQQVSAKPQQKRTAKPRVENKRGVRRQRVAQQQRKPAQPQAVKKARGRDVIIAIDAGHGGEDSGAEGGGGTYEKDVVLEIAKNLKKLLDEEGGMRGVLVRKSDYYIPLRKRMEIARTNNADFFVSIHADAFPDPSARGSSVYVLSNKGGVSEAARWLAERENQADLIGGVSLDDKDEVLASVLLDLSQAASRQVSHEVAQMTIRNLRKAGSVHFRDVQKAGFVVLKSPDIPSMLVEVAFISNPQEEQKLRDGEHQESFAKAILAGIRRHFHQAPPPDSWLAMRHKQKVRGKQYVIVAGDTLSEIAQRYQVSLSRLKDHNKLGKNAIRAGQVLKIPTES